MLVGEIRQFCKLQDEGQSLMRAAMTRQQFIGACLCTAQCHRILKLGRTITDLAGSEDILSAH